MTDGASGSVQDLEDVVIGPAGSATARAVLALDVNGRVAGFTTTNDGSTSSFTILTDDFKIVGPGDIHFTPFEVTSAGVVKMHSVEIDTLKTNTAIVPRRTAATQPVAGNSTAASPHANSTVLTLIVTMSAPGWIEVFGFGQQGYSAAAAYSSQLYVNGTQIPEATTGGATTSPQNSFTVQGSYMATAAGDFTITMSWDGNTGVTLNQRSLIAHGFPNTQ